MKYIKLIPTLLMGIIVVLSFVGILADEYFMPLMLIFLGLSNFIIAYDTFKSNQKRTAYLNLAVGVFLYAAVIYAMFFNGSRDMRLARK